MRYTLHSLAGDVNIAATAVRLVDLDHRVTGQHIVEVGCFDVGLYDLSTEVITVASKWSAILLAAKYLAITHCIPFHICVTESP